MTNRPDDPGEYPGGTPAGDSGSGPLITWAGTVQPAWIDINDHMNVSGYDQVFDAAENRLFTAIGIDDASIIRTGLTIFRLERLIAYERELRLGDRVETRSRVIWTDLRRVHHFHELWNLDRACRAACADTLSIQVDLQTRRPARIERPEVREPLERLLARQSALPVPAGVLPRVDGRRTQR